MVVTEVLSVDAVGAKITRLLLRTPSGFAAYPGQFILVRAMGTDEEIGRHYTISSPYVTDSFEITVETTLQGDLSSWLAERTTGDELQIEGPFGRTYYTGNGPVVVIAAGPGIGAGIGVAERAIDEGNTATLIYKTGALAYEARLAQLARQSAVVYVVAQSTLASVLTTIKTDTGFVFGYRSFIDDVRRGLREIGRSPDDLAYENYGVRPT